MVTKYECYVIKVGFPPLSDGKRIKVTARERSTEGEREEKDFTFDAPIKDAGRLLVGSCVTVSVEY